MELARAESMIAVTRPELLSRRKWITLTAAWCAGACGSKARAESEPPPSAESQPEQTEPSAVSPEPAPKRVIALAPLGPELPDGEISLVQAALGAFYAYEVELLPRLPLPKHAFVSARKRYRAEKLLGLLQEVRPRHAFRVLGLTASDISTTKGKIADWGILGLANIDGSACVISSFRTRRGANERRARERFAKTAVHEIGHTLGLLHCPNRGCLMEDGKGTVFTTDGEYDLCWQCRSKLVQRGVPLGKAGELIPWAKPG